MFTRRAIFLTAAVAGALLVSGGEALAAPVACGETITTDTTLENDLVDCPNNGIVIGANNVTLDLNGHTIDGDDALVDPCPENEFCDIGVANERHRGVAILGGDVREFGFGVLLAEARGNRLARLASVRNHFNGVVIFASSGIRVQRNRVARNGLTVDFPGLAVFDSHDLRIERNRLSRNADLGLFAIDVNDSRIVRNTISRNPELGVILEGDGNDFDRNRIVRNGGGIALSGDGNSIMRNRITKSRIAGISLEGGDDNLIARNELRRTGRDGILLGGFGPHGQDNVVRGNLVRETGRDGVRIAKKATDSLLKRNRVSGAGDDGIDVRRAATKLTRNHARHNHDLGIEAVNGVIDGGGNRASGNGDSRQCVHVTCQ